MDYRLYYKQQLLADIDNRISELQKMIEEDPDLADLAVAEIEELEKQRFELEQSAQTPMAPAENPQPEAGGPLDHTIAILEIRSAAGGDEAEPGEAAEGEVDFHGKTVSS